MLCNCDICQHHFLCDCEDKQKCMEEIKCENENCRWCQRRMKHNHVYLNKCQTCGSDHYEKKICKDCNQPFCYNEDTDPSCCFVRHYCPNHRPHHQNTDHLFNCVECDKKKDVQHCPACKQKICKNCLERVHYLECDTTHCLFMSCRLTVPFAPAPCPNCTEGFVRRPCQPKKVLSLMRFSH